ncbi:MAG: acetyltransferase [Gemmatimonadota bacterium]|nr:acetyltransferase [Gemmatimonadota bacterium]
MSSSYVVIGAGGHARVLIAAMKAAGTVPVACLDNDPARWNVQVLGITVVGGDELLPSLGAPDQLFLVNGVGSAGRIAARRAVWDKFSSLGYRFASVRDPRAIISEGVLIDAGAQVLAGAVVQPGTRIGSDAIVNTGACVDHDCVIGSHAHIAPGAVLCGDVEIGDSSHVGAGAIVRQGVRVGSGAVIAMGAVVISDVDDHSTVGGIPARPFRETGITA